MKDLAAEKNVKNNSRSLYGALTKALTNSNVWKAHWKAHNFACYELHVTRLEMHAQFIFFEMVSRVVQKQLFGVRKSG